MTPNLSDRLDASVGGRGAEAVSKINELKGKIQRIKFPFSQSVSDPAQQMPTGYNSNVAGLVNNGVAPAQTPPQSHQLLKPSGKLKFKSAQRFFRMEMVPLLKKIEPALDS